MDFPLGSFSPRAVKKFLKSLAWQRILSSGCSSDCRGYSSVRP
jgi:hypothetical protein